MINKLAWESVMPGGAIVDKYNRPWGVVRRDADNPMKLIARCSGYTPMALVWEQGKITDEEGNPIPEFDDDAVHVITD
jgi:hypothetical protein